MAQYNSLSQLRGELTEDDADKRATAYSAVLEADVKPSDVLGPQVSDEARTALVDGGVIPEDDGGGRPGSEALEEAVELLREIRDNTGGSA